MLLPVREEQDAIMRMRMLKREGKTLMQIRDEMRASGFKISHETVRQLIRRGAGAPEGWPAVTDGRPQVPAKEAMA
jgi:hypothetical protein